MMLFTLSLQKYATGFSVRKGEEKEQTSQRWQIPAIRCYGICNDAAASCIANAVSDAP
jgi:hypothetical protein